MKKLFLNVLICFGFVSPAFAGEELVVASDNILVRELLSCWKPPIGNEKISDESFADYTKAVEYKLRNDGTLHSVFVVPSQKKLYEENDEFRIIADSFIQSIKDCTPLKPVTREEYPLWKAIGFTNIPIQMTKEEIASRIREHFARCLESKRYSMSSALPPPAFLVSLRRDGSIESVKLWAKQREFFEDKEFKAIAFDAVPAIKKCLPIDLPSSQYETWKELVVHLDGFRK